MNRNEIRRKIEEILNDKNLSEEEKKNRILELCQKEEQGFGGMPLRKLLKQIEKEYGIPLSEARLFNELGGIAKKGDVTDDGDDNGDDDNASPTVPTPVLVP